MNEYEGITLTVDLVVQFASFHSVSLPSQLRPRSLVGFSSSLVWGVGFEPAKAYATEYLLSGATA